MKCDCGGSKRCPVCLGRLAQDVRLREVKLWTLFAQNVEQEGLSHSSFAMDVNRRRERPRARDLAWGKLNLSTRTWSGPRFDLPWGHASESFATGRELLHSYSCTMREQDPGPCLLCISGFKRRRNLC